MGVNSLYAQKNLTDDKAYQAILKIKNDTVRVKKTVEYANSLITKKNPLGGEVASLAIKDAIASKNNHSLGIAYLAIGYSYILTGEYTLAYPNYIQALNIYQKINEPKNLWRAYLDLTWVQIQFQEYKSAETYIQNALTIAKQENLILEEATTYNYMGILNDSQLKYDAAIGYYKQALALNEKKGTEFNQISTLTNLGISQRRSKRYKEAYDSFLKAKTLVDKGNVGYFKQSIYQNLAELTFQMNDYENAETYILQALAFSNGNNELVLKRGLFTNLYEVYKKKGEFEKALKYADSARDLDVKVFSKDKVAEILNLQTKYDTKLKDEQIAKQNVLNLQQHQLLEINKKQLELTLEQKKNAELTFAKRQNELQNEKALQESVIQKDRLQAKLDKQASEQQISLQQGKIETNKKFQFFLAVVALMAISISILIFYNQRKTRRLNELITQQKKDLENINGVKDRIFTIISHDMRAPVNTLISFNHLLEDHDLSSEKIKRYAKEINKTLDHTSILMENLLNWSRSQLQGYKPNSHSHSLKNISNQVIQTLSGQAAKKGISLIDHIGPDATVYADADMTELIMRNIVANAIKFTPNNGVIELNTSLTENQTTFSVSDNGVGITAQLVEQLNSTDTSYHTPTQLGTNKEKGTGLGLMLCKAFTTLMKGEILVTSEVGKGSVIFVTLPKLAS